MNNYIFFAVQALKGSTKQYTSEKELKIDLGGENVSNRLLSLDAFRGMTIAGMILVIIQEAGAMFIPHFCMRNGMVLHLQISSFLFFFIMGVSIAFAYSRQMKKNLPKEVMVKKIIKRSIILFLMGLFLVSYH